MDKRKEYNTPEEENRENRVEEPAAEYQCQPQASTTISDKELMDNCMTLDESKQQMLGRIRADSFCLSNP